MTTAMEADTFAVEITLLQDVEDVMSDMTEHFPRNGALVLQQVGAVLNAAWAARRREEGERETWDRSDQRLR